MRPECNGLRHVLPSAPAASQYCTFLLTPGPTRRHGNLRVSWTIQGPLDIQSRLMSVPATIRLRLKPPIRNFRADTFSRTPYSTASVLRTEDANSQGSSERAFAATGPRRRSYAAHELFEPGEDQTLSESESVSAAGQSLVIFTKADWKEELGRLAASCNRISATGKRNGWTRFRHERLSTEWQIPEPGAPFLTLRKWWISFDFNARSQQWPSIMVWYLQNRPRQSLNFMLASLTQPLPVPYQVVDVLDLAARYIFSGSRHEERIGLMQTLRRITSYALRLYDEPLPLSQHTIRIIARNIPASEAYGFYYLLRNRGVELDSLTLLHLSQLFTADASQHEAALETLTEAVRYSDAECPQELLQKICSRLLRRAAESVVRDPMSVIAQFKSLGIDFSTRVYNALIANASDQGRYETAWDLYNLLIDPDLQPDCATFSTLFKMCRRTNDDLAFQRLFKEVRQMESDRDDFKVNDVLACEMIYCSYCFASGDGIERMIRVYRRYYDLQPLANLGILRENDPQRIAELQYALPSRAEHRFGAMFYGPRAPPPPRALVLIVMAFLRRRNLRQKLLEQIYNNFKAAITREDPQILPLANMTLVWDSFLKAFGRYNDMFHMWPEVIRDMTAPVRATSQNLGQQERSLSAQNSDLFEEPESAEELQFPEKASLNSVKFFTAASPIKGIKPTEQTWSILLHAFVAHDHIEAAERVLGLMKSHGLEPNVVTWNTIIRGWTNSGETEKVQDALAQIKNGGWRWNRNTSRALSSDQSSGRPERMGLGAKVKGGGLPTGHRLPNGSFELIEEGPDFTIEARLAETASTT